MKNIITISLAFLLATETTIAIQHIFAPENTVIVSDLDDVLIQQSPYLKMKLVLGGIAQNPANGINYLKALYALKQEYKRDADGGKKVLYDTENNLINGLTFHFLYHGIQNKELTPYVPWMVKTIEESRTYINDTKKIYDYLKHKKGYSIVFATNKDRISYDITAQSLGPDFYSMPDTTFVAHPGNDQSTLKNLEEFAETNAPAEYKKLFIQAMAIKECDQIKHVPTSKPNVEYYRHTHNVLGTDKNIIFIDDKKSNITGFKQLQNDTTAHLKGIHFKHPAQLADKFVKLGILSETNDKIFLEEIRYPGIWGKMQLYTKKFLDMFFTKNNQQKRDV